MRSLIAWGSVFSLLIVAISGVDDGSSSTLDQSDIQVIQDPVDEMTLEEQTRLLELDERMLYQFNNVELAEYLNLKTKAERSASDCPHPREKAGIAARRSVGKPFRLNAVQFDLAESDCVSFVNRMLALSVASDWDSYYVIIERIRHKDGIVDYRNRNFHTLADWLPNNSWLLEDVTALLGPEGSKTTEPFTHVIRPKVFEERPAAPGSRYTRITFKGSDYSSPNAEVRTDFYIPTERMAEILPDLNTGDVILVLRNANGGHLGCDHMGMVVRGPDEVNIVHSAPPEVIQEPLFEFLHRCNWIVGLKFLRMKDNARHLSAQEVARLSESINVLTPSEQDAKVFQLRDARAAAGSQK